MPIKIDELSSRKGLRKDQILKILEDHPDLAYNTQELAELLNVSDSTITRALVYLIQQKKIVKGYNKGTTAKVPYYYFNSQIDVEEIENK